MKKFSLFLFLCLWFISCTKEKVAYIDLAQVFNGFKYKVELEKELTEVKNQRKFKLDSLEALLKLLSNKVKFDPKNKDHIIRYQTEKELYFKQKYLYEDEEEGLVKSYDAKIISQLNSYVKEYGAQHHYSIIFGATSTGNVMYADTSLNISRDVIQFINQKYIGK
jgi:outer membrane protein